MASLVVILLQIRASAALTEPVSAALSTPDSLTLMSNEVAADPAHPVQVLLDEVHLAIDAAGRTTRTSRLIYRIDSKDGAAAWSEVQMRWSPWFQLRPSVQAQVVSAGGRRHLLDPVTISEQPVRIALNTYTDDRLMSGPLPAMSDGSIVEETWVLRDTAAVVGPAITHVENAVTFAPVRLRRLTVETPPGVPLRHRVEALLGVDVERAEDERGTRLAFTLRNQAPIGLIESDAPADTPRVPAIVICTGTSWADVAARYRTIVERQIADDPGAVAVRDFARAIAADAPPGQSRVEPIRQAVRRLHRGVRYTGVEFGQASVRPVHPSETLKRHYGDCKDKSLLLVALLRELGIPARIALLRSGNGYDLRRDMPGWGSFDHAIVQVPGEPPLWLDATDAFGRVGQLPSDVEGRLALVIDEDNRDPVAAPASTSADHGIVMTREVFLEERGMPRVVETTELHGRPEADHRMFYGAMPPSDLDEMMTAYARRTFQAEGRVTAKMSDVQDFDGPFRLTIDVERAGIGLTTLSDAMVMTPLGAVLTELPFTLTSFDEDSLRIPGYTGGRRQDLVLRPPVRCEIRYRIVPPAGFQPGALPEGGERRFGPMVLREAFLAESSGTVLASAIFDPVVTRLSPDEVLAFREAYAAFMRSNEHVVSFLHRGLALSREGRLMEAIRLLRADVELDEHSAPARMRLARGLLESGLGEAARVEARRAVELAPEDAGVYENLAWVLSHDLLGRLQRNGFDRDGAVAAYRRAIELDPEDPSLQVGLAILLEHDPSGLRYSPDADLDEAIRIYRSIPKEDLAAIEVTQNLPVALAKTNRFEELEQWARRNGDHSLARRSLILAIAATRGAEAAIAESMNGIPTEAERSQALSGAAVDLLATRRYQDVGRLMRAASRGSENAATLLAQAQMFESLRPAAPERFRADDPAGLFPRMMRALLIGSDAADSLYALSPRSTWAAMDSSRSPLEEGLAQLNRGMRALGMPPEVFVDLLLDRLEVRIEGDRTIGCVRARCQIPSRAPADLYATIEDGRWVVVEFDTDGTLRGLGWAALDALESGRPGAARQWLEWAIEALPVMPPDSTVSGPFWAFREGVGRADPVHMKLAAAALLAGGEPHEARRALVALASVDAARIGPAESEASRWVRAIAFTSARRPDSALTCTEDLLDRHPGSELLFNLQSRIASQRGDPGLLRRAAEVRLARDPGDRPALRQLLRLAGAEGDPGQVRAAAARLEEAHLLAPEDQNNWAWYELLAGSVDDATLARASRSVLAESPPIPERLHTQACVFAELGRTAEARDVLIQYMDMSSLAEPDGSAWYVLGRIAEQYGMVESAMDAYRRAVTLEEAQHPEPGLGHEGRHFAARRLHALEAASELTGAIR